MFTGVLRALGVIEPPARHVPVITGRLVEEGEPAPAPKPALRAVEVDADLLGVDELDGVMNESGDGDMNATLFRQGIPKTRSQTRETIRVLTQLCRDSWDVPRVVRWMPVLSLKTTFSELLKGPPKLEIQSADGVALPDDHRYAMVNAHVIYVRNRGLPYTIEWHIDGMDVPIIGGRDDEYLTDFQCQSPHVVNTFYVGKRYTTTVASFMANDFTQDQAWIGVIEAGSDVLVPMQNRFCRIIRRVVVMLLVDSESKCIQVADRIDKFYWKIDKSLFGKAIEFIMKHLTKPALPRGHVLRLRGTLGRMDERPTWADGVPMEFDANQTVDVLVQLCITYAAVQ